METENILFEFAGALVSLSGAVLKLLLPLLIGLILAYLLNGPVMWLEKKIKSRMIAILLTYIAVGAALIALVYGFIILIIGALPKGGPAETLAFIENYYTNAVHSVYDFLGKYMPSASDNTQKLLRSLQNRFYELFSPASVLAAVYSLIGGFISLFVGIVASVYLLKDKEFFIGLWEKFLCLTIKQRMHGLICEVMQDINKVLSTFIRGAILDSLCVAFLSSLALSILKIEYSVIIGIIAGILNIIPYFGPFFGMVPAFLVAAFSKGLFYGIASAFALFLVQQIDSNYIYPKLVGEATGIHPLFVLLSVSIFGSFWGIVGMLLAVPAAGIIQILITRLAYAK